MAISLPLLIEPGTKKAFASLFSEQEVLIPPLVHGESVNVSVSKVQRIVNPTGARIWEPVAVPIASNAIKVAFGKAFQLPVAGDFTISWGGDTTAAIGYAPTAQEIEDALNDLASITTAGGVTVREPADAAGNFFLIEWENTGARSLITGNATNLAPLSVLDIGTELPGSAGSSAVQTLRVVQSPGAFVILGADLPAAACTPVLIQTADASHNQRYRIALDPIPYDGSFSIVVDNQTDPEEESELISVNATAAQFLAILEAMTCVGAGNARVIDEGNFSWVVTFASSLAHIAVEITEVTVGAVKVLPGQYGILDLATAGIEITLAGQESTSAILETRVTPTGEGGQVWLQYVGTLNDALIDPSSTTPTPSEDGLGIFTTASVSAAGNNTIGSGYLQRSFQLICSAGAGSYTRKIVLDIANATNGDMVFILIEIAASANPTVEIRNATSGGATLHSLAGSGAGAQYQSVTLTYTGSAWLKIASEFIS